MTPTHKSRRILLIASDVIKKNMTGPGIRFWEFSRVLSQYFTVTLAIPPTIQAIANPNELAPTFEVTICETEAELEILVGTMDIVIVTSTTLSIYPFLTRIDKPLVVDMYIPFLLEGLQYHEKREFTERVMYHEGLREAHTFQIRAADYIICASEKQKDYWLGWLAALGRLNPYTHQQDATFAKLIDVVPFGLPREPATHTKQVIKGVYNGIGADDKVIIWGGGIWNWLDAETLIRAMKPLATSHPEIKLFFMGLKSPNPSSAAMEAPTRAVELSKTLGLYEQTIFFNDWAPYHERQNYLLEADVGASLHLNHIETRFSFRTRLLDYIWTGLPILTTTGDVMSDLVKEWNLGFVVDCGNSAQISETLVEMLQTKDLREHYKPHFDLIRSQFEWEQVMLPLINFCESPRLAPDKPYLAHIPIFVQSESAWWRLPGKTIEALHDYGLAGAVYKIHEYIQWRMKKLGRK